MELMQFTEFIELMEKIELTDAMELIELTELMEFIELIELIEFMELIEFRQKSDDSVESIDVARISFGLNTRISKDKGKKGFVRLSLICHVKGKSFGESDFSRRCLARNTIRVPLELFREENQI